ncbi:amidohydrolase family protein [Cellulomonas xiejunii]|uniref:Amidohydrolase family protein n=1 Tax=Cellulomonas xiejunii TaxID=2968083 RepID=A0ABY5KSW3_9CELL|nr:amidohydrolase family protein [Cellulomonas xiejunii]MCC2323038.1 amidohydrolase family protein [Cellulomonas xiejunii]UUI73534.1 amidohydrolase family protein [Cellulomonas xiejunii]
MNRVVIINVRPWGGPASDVVVTDGVVAAVTAHEPARAPAPDDVAGDGRILLPSFSDVHVHLDSTLVGLPFRPHSVPSTRTLWDCVMNDRRNWRSAGAGVAERAATTLGRAIGHGLTQARSYAQVDADCRLERLEGVLAARDEHAARAEVQVVAFPQAGLLLEPGVPDLMRAALEMGADVMGGIDPCSLDQDPVEHLDIVFDLAQRHDVPVDIHLHEAGELGLFSTRLVLERVRALGMASRVTLAHSFALGQSPLDQVRPVLDRLAELDVAVTTVAPGPREGLPLLELVARGVRTGLGQDGQRDYWSPYGTTDMLDRTWQLAFTQGWNADELIEHALAVATVGGRSVVDPSSRRLTSVTDRPGVDPGDPADLVLVQGDTPTAAVMDRLGGRTVLRAGRVVAHDGVLV